MLPCPVYRIPREDRRNAPSMTPRTLDALAHSGKEWNSLGYVEKRLHVWLPQQGREWPECLMNQFL